ncbi:UNVERIFIED_CONTAM: hypothetical protein HHA_236930 [Hammondia hammondi]|eukprot:XP_008885453.1 hypothetical protein HHA_236930 [Hammondia hammondi]
MEDPRASFPSSCTSGRAFSHRRTYGDVQELGKGGSSQVPGEKGGGEVSACSPAQSYAVAARVVASCAVDLQAFPLTSRTSFAIPRISSSTPANVSLFRRLPLIGRLLGPSQGRVSSPEVAAGLVVGSAASLPASALCCPELSSLLPNSHVCRWRNQVCVTAWRDSTVYCYVLPVPSSCFLEEGEKTRQPPRASAGFYYVHEQPVGLARLLPEHGLLLVAGNLDEGSLDSASGDVFLLQYDSAYLHSSSEPSSVHRSKDDAPSSPRPSIPSPFQAFKVFPLRPSSEVDSGSAAEQVPMRIKRRFRIAAPIHGLSLAVSSHAGLLLFSASVRKKKASLLFLSGEAIEDLKAACDEAAASKESATRDAAAASEAEAPTVFSESEDREETGGAAAVEAAPGRSFPTENVPFSFCTSEHLPTLPSAPTAYAVDRRAQRFFVGGFDTEEGRVWVAVTNFCRLRPELDEDDYNDPQKLRLQRAFLEEQPQRVAEDEEPEPNTEFDRPFVLLLPLLSCLRYAAKVAASLKRKSLQNGAEKLPETSLRKQKREASVGLRHACESPPETAEGETTVLSFLDEPWGAQFYRPVAIAELRSLLSLDVEATFSSGQEAASAERFPDEEVETFLLSHDPASARGYSCSQPLSSFPKAGSDSRTLPRRSASGRLRPSPKLEQDEAVDIAHIAVSRSGRRLAVTLSTCEVLILVRNEGASPVGFAHVGDATAGRTEKPTELPRQTPPQNSRRPSPLGNPEDKATTAPPRPSATSEETYSASTVQPDHASDPSSAPYLPWLYLPAPFVASLRVSMSLGRREVRNRSEPLASPTVSQAISSPTETCTEDRFSLVSSLQRYPEYEGLSGLLGCAFSSAAAPGRSEEDAHQGRSEEDAEDVLLLVLGMRASRERLQGLAGFAQKAGASSAPSGNAETVLTTSQTKTASVFNVDQYKGGGNGGLSPASGGGKAGPAVNLSGAAQSQEPVSGDGGAGLLCDELRPTPCMAVDVCALSLKGVHAFLEREGGAVSWEKPVLTVLPNAAPQVTGSVQRWLCPCSAASEALGVGLLPPSWGEGDEHELWAGKQTWTEGTAKDREVAPNPLTLVVTLENQGDEGKERGNPEARDWCVKRERSTLRIWAVEVQSVERLAMELRRRSRFAEAERVCTNALENLSREQCVFSAPEEDKTESASNERERERATSFQRYRNLLEDIREERWTQRGRHPDAAEEDFKVFFSLCPRDPAWLVSQALAYNPFQLVPPPSASPSVSSLSARALQPEATSKGTGPPRPEFRALPCGAEKEEEASGDEKEEEASGLEKRRRQEEWREEAQSVQRWSRGLERLERILLFLLSDGDMERPASPAVGVASPLEQGEGSGRRVTAGFHTPEQAKDRAELRERLRRCRLFALFCNSPASASPASSLSGAAGSRQTQGTLRPPLVLSTPLQPFGWGTSDSSWPQSRHSTSALESPSHSFGAASSFSRSFDAVGGAASFSSLSCLSLSLSSLLLSPTSSSEETSDEFLQSLCCVWSATCRLDCIVAVLQGPVSSEVDMQSALSNTRHWPRILSSLPEALNPVHYLHLLPLLSPAVSSLSSPFCRGPPASSGPWGMALFPQLALSSVAAPSMPRVSSAPEGGAPSFLLVESDPRRFLSWALRRLFVVLKRTELIRTVALPLLHAVLSLAVKQRLPQSLKRANRRSRKQALERAAAAMLALAVSEARRPEAQEEVGRCAQQKRTPVTPTAETVGAKSDVKKQENAGSEEDEKTLEDARVSALAVAVLAVGASSKNTCPLTTEAPSWSRSQPPRATNRGPVSPRQGSAEPSEAPAGAAMGDEPEEASISQKRADGDEGLPGPRRSRASTSLSESLGSEPKAKEGEKEMNKTSPYSVLGSRPDGFASSQTLKSPGPPSPLLLAVAGDQLRALYALHVALTQFLFYEEDAQRRRSAQTRARLQRGDEGGMSDLWEAPPHETAGAESLYLKRNWEGRTYGVVAPAATTLLPREKQNIDFFTFVQLPLQTRLALLTGVTHWRRDSASWGGEVEGGANREPEGSLEDRERAEAVSVVEKLRRRVVLPQLLFDDIFFGMNAREGKTEEGKATCDAVSPAFGSQLHLTCAFGGGRGRNVQRPELAGPLRRTASASSPFSRSTLSSPADFCACLNAFCASPVPQQIADFCLEVLPWSSASLNLSVPDNSSAASPLGDHSLATRSLRLSGDRGADASCLGRLSLAVVAEVVRASSPLVSPSVRLLRRRSDVGEIALCAVYHRSSLLPASSLLPLVDRLYNALPQSFEEEDAVEPVFPAGKEEQGERTYGGDTGCTERSGGQLERAERAWVLERRKRLRVLAGGADMLEQHLDAIEFLNRHLAPSLPSVTFQQLKAACLSPSSARLMCASLLRALCRTPRATSAGTTPQTEGRVYSSCARAAICSQPITCNELLDRAVYIHRRACAALPPEELYEILLTTCATEVSFASSAPPSPSAGGFASVLQHLRPLARGSGSSLARAPSVASTVSAKRLLVEALLERWRDVALLAGDARLEAFFPRAAACLLTCARDLVNAAPSLTDPSLAAARELLLICLGLDRERRRVRSQRRAERNACRGEAAGSGLQSQEIEAFSQDTQLQRGTKRPLAAYAGRSLLSPEHKEDATCLAMDRQSQVLTRQVRSELRFVALVQTLSALLASKLVSGDAAPGDGLRRALASTVSAEGTNVFGVEFEALASFVAGSSAKAAKAAVVGAARGGGALARGALEASGSAASSTMRLLRSYGSLSAENRLIDGEVTQVGAAEAEISRRLDSVASFSARSSDALGKQLSPQETEPTSHSWGPLSSSASASVSFTSPTSGLASLSGWPSTPLQVRLAAAEPGGLARVVQTILRACPEAADEAQLLEKLAALLEREGEEGNWRGRWRLYEARAWAYWVRGRAGEALSVLATLLVLQQRSLEGETETRRRAAERRTNDKQRNAVEGEHGADSGHSNEVHVKPLREGEERERVIAVDSVESGTELCTSQKTLQRTARRSEGRKRPSRCLLHLIAENDPSLSVLTLQFAQKRSLSFVFETGEGPSSFSSSFSSSVDAQKAPSQATCLSPNVRGALLALAVRRCDALHLPLLLGAFAAVQHEHCMLQAAALLPRKAFEGARRGTGKSFDEGDTKGGAADAQSFLGDPSQGEAFPTSPVQPDGEKELQKRAIGTSSPELPFLERESGASSGWIPATSADWFSSGASASLSCSPWPFPSLKEGESGGDREDESASNLLAPPGGASTFWTRGGVGGLEQVGDREAEKSLCRSAGGQAGAGTADFLVRDEMTASSVFPKVLTTSLFLRARQALGLSASSRDAPPQADSTSASEGSAGDSSSSSSLASPPFSVFSSSLRTIRPPPVAPAAVVFSAIGVAEGMVNFAASRARQEYDKRLASLSASSSFLGEGREGRAAEPEATSVPEGTAGSEVPLSSSRGFAGDSGRMRGDSDPHTTRERTSLPRRDSAGPLADALRAVRPRSSSSIEEKERRQHGEGTSAGEAPPADAHLAGASPAGGQVQRHEEPIARGKKNAPFHEAEHEGESGRKEQEGTSSRLGFSRFLPYGAKEGDDKKARTVARPVERHGDSEVSPEAILTAEAHVLESVAELSAMGPSILPSLRFWPQAVAARPSLWMPFVSSQQPPASGLERQSLLSFSPASGWDLPLLLFGFFLLQTDKGSGEERETTGSFKGKHPSRRVGGEMEPHVKNGERRSRLSLAERHVAGVQPFLRALLQTDVEAAFLVAALLSLNSPASCSPSTCSASGGAAVFSSSRSLGLWKKVGAARSSLQQGDATCGPFALPQCAFALLRSYLSASGHAAERSGERKRASSALSPVSPSVSALSAPFCPPARAWNGAACVVRADVSTEVLLQLLLRWVTLFFASHSSGDCLASVASPSRICHPVRELGRGETAHAVFVSAAALFHSLFLVRDFFHVSDAVLLLLGLLPQRIEETDGDRGQRRAPAVAFGGDALGEASALNTPGASFLPLLARDAAFRRQLLLQVTQAFPEKLDVATALLPVASALQWPLNGLKTRPLGSRSVAFSLLSLSGDRVRETESQKQGRVQEVPAETRHREARTQETEAIGAEAKREHRNQTRERRASGQFEESGLSPLESREQSWGLEQEGLEAFRMRLETFDGLFLSPLQPLSSFVVKLLEQLPLLFFVPSENRGRGRGGRGGVSPRPEEEGGGEAEEREDGRGEQGGVWETGRWILRLLRIYTKALALCRFYAKSTDGLVLEREVKTLLDVGGDAARDVEAGDESRGAENRDEERRALHLGAQLQAAGVFAREKERPVSSVSGAASPCSTLQGILEKTVFLRALFSCAARVAGCSSRAFLSEVLCEDRQPPRRRRDIKSKEEGAKQLGNGEGEREGGSQARPSQERIRNSREAAQCENVARIIRDTGLGCTQVDDAMSAFLSLLPLVDVTSIFLPRSLAAQQEGSETERAGDDEEEREAGRGKEAPAQSEEESGQDPFLQAVLEALGGSTSWKKSQSLPGEGTSIALLTFFQKGPSVFSRRSPSSFVAEALLLRDLEGRLVECSSMSLVSLSSVGPGRQKDDGGSEDGEAGNCLEEGNKARKAVQPVPADDVDAEDFVSLLLPFIPLSRWEATVANLSVRVGLHWGATQKGREAGCPFVRQAVLLYLVQRMRRALEKRMQAGEIPKGEQREVAEDEEVEASGGKESQLMSRNVEPIHLLQKLRFQEAWLLLSTAWDHALARSSSFSVSCFPPRMSPQGSPSFFDPHTQNPSNPSSLPSSSPSSSPFSPCSPLVSSPPGELRQQQESLASACVNVLLYCEESKFPAFASSFWFALCSCPASLFPDWQSWLEAADHAGERIHAPKARSAFVAAGLRSLRTRAANLLSGLSVSEGGVDEACEDRIESERGRKVLSSVADAEAGSAVGAFLAAGLLPWLQKLHARLCEESSGREARPRETASHCCGVSDTATVLFAHTGHHFQLLLRRLAGVPGSDAVRKSLFTALAKAVCSWIMTLFAECGAEAPVISSFSPSLRTPRRENDAQTLLFSLVLSDSLLQHCDESSHGTCAAPRASADAVDPSPFSHLEAILLCLTAQCVRVLAPLGPQVEETLGDASRGERECTWLSAVAPSSPLSLSALSSLFAKHKRQSQRLRGEAGGEAGGETEKSEEEQVGATERSMGFEFCRAFIEARLSSSQPRLRRRDSDRENVCREIPLSSATRAAANNPLGKPLLLCERRSKQQRLRDRLCGVVLLRAAEDEENRRVQRGGASDREPSAVCFSSTANRLWVPPAAFALEEDAETAKDQTRGRSEKRDGEDEEKRTSQPQPASPRSSVSLWRSLLAGAESEEEALLIALVAPPNWSLMDAGDGQEREFPSVSWFSSSPALHLLTASTEGKTAFSLASLASELERPQAAVRRALAWLQGWEAAPFFQGPQLTRLTSRLDKGHALLLVALTALSGASLGSASLDSAVVATLANGDWLEPFETDAREADARRENLQSALPGLVIFGDSKRRKETDSQTTRAGKSRSSEDSWDLQDPSEDAATRQASFRSSRSLPAFTVFSESFKSWPAVRAQVAAAVCAWYRQLAREDGQEGDGEEECRDEREECLLAVLAHVLQWLVLLRPHLLSRHLREARVDRRETARALHAREAERNGDEQQAGEARKEDRARWRLTALQNAVYQYRLSLATAPLPRSRAGVLVRRPWSRPVPEGSEEGKAHFSVFWEVEREDREPGDHLGEGQLACPARPGWRCRFPATAWLLYRAALEAQDEEEEEGREGERQRIRENAEARALTERLGTQVPSVASSLAPLPRLPFASTCEAGALCGSFLLFATGACPAFLAAVARQREEVDDVARASYLERSREMRRASALRESGDSLWRHVTGRLGEAVQKVSWLL